MTCISSYFYAPAYTCAHTPTATPIAHTHPFLSYLSYIYRYFALMTVSSYFYAPPTPTSTRPRPLFTLIPSFHSYHIHSYFALMTYLQLFLRPRLHLRPRPYDLAPTPMPTSTSTLIAHTHSFLPLLLCIGDVSPVISTPSPTPTPIVTPIHTCPCLRPLLTPITSFRSSDIYVYIYIVTYHCWPVPNFSCALAQVHAHTPTVMLTPISSPIANTHSSLS